LINRRDYGLDPRSNRNVIESKNSIEGRLFVKLRSKELSIKVNLQSVCSTNDDIVIVNINM
jgi:hypothetical protein